MIFQRFTTILSSCILAVCLLISTLFSMPVHAADSEKNSYAPDFLKKPEPARIWWYMGTFTVLGHLTSISNKTQGDCVWNWYFKDPKKKRKVIEDTMRKFPKHSPSGVILALLFKDCGEFKVQ